MSRLLEYLDNGQSVRQAQISFASRIPNAIPTYDAVGMLPNLQLFCNELKFDPSVLLRSSSSSTAHHPVNLISIDQHLAVLPTVHIVSQHANGSLNLWQVGV